MDLKLLLLLLVAIHFATSAPLNEVMKWKPTQQLPSNMLVSTSGASPPTPLSSPLKGVSLPAKSSATSGAGQTILIDRQKKARREEEEIKAFKAKLEKVRSGENNGNKVQLSKRTLNSPALSGRRDKQQRPRQAKMLGFQTFLGKGAPFVSNVARPSFLRQQNPLDLLRNPRSLNRSHKRNKRGERIKRMSLPLSELSDRDLLTLIELLSPKKTTSENDDTKSMMKNQDYSFDDGEEDDGDQDVYFSSSRFQPVEMDFDDDDNDDSIGVADVEANRYSSPLLISSHPIVDFETFPSKVPDEDSFVYEPDESFSRDNRVIPSTKFLRTALFSDGEEGNLDEQAFGKQQSSIDNLPVLPLTDSLQGTPLFDNDRQSEIAKLLFLRSLLSTDDNEDDNEEEDDDD